MMPSDGDPLGLCKLITGLQAGFGTPDLAILNSDTLYHAGTTVPVLAVQRVASSANGLIIPEGSAVSVMDYIGVYIVLEDYIFPTDITIDMKTFCRSIIESAIVSQGTDNLLRFLSVLDIALGKPDDLRQIQTEFIEGLSPVFQARLTARITSADDRRVFLTRQSILASVQIVLMHDYVPPVPGPTSLGFWGILLTHAVASGLANEPPETSDTIGGIPATLAAEMVRNCAFNESEDIYGSIDRQKRIWKVFGHLGGPFLGGKHPADLVHQITGIQVEDFLALGFALYAHAMGWTPQKPLHLAEDFSDIDPDILQRFLSLVASTRDDLHSRLTQNPPRTNWDFLAIQDRPILRTPEGLLVLDGTYLFGRITTGLYWIVHDYLRDNYGEQDRLRWTQAWGAMVEALAEEDIEPHSPPIFGDPDSTTFYTEEDLACAYPDSKAADVVVDLGVTFVAFEIVSGQLTTGTRIDGTPEAFMKDMEKLVFKKMRQLDATATNLVFDERPLTAVQGPSRPDISRDCDWQ